VISDRRLRVVDVQMAASDPLCSARTALSPLSACDGLAVHFDVDLVDFLDAPLAENTDRGTAPSLTACGEIPRATPTRPRPRCRVAFQASNKWRQANTICDSPS
jgi:arginase